MAPRKRKTEGGEEASKPETKSMRVTRSATRRVNSNSTYSATESTKPELPKKNKKAEPAAKRKKEEVKTEETEKSDDEARGGESNQRTIVIEHCKQCKSFKTRADQVKAGLEKDVIGITVVLNPEKPRRGCFEIREEGGEKFISLLDMKRPFTPMKELDMTKVISDIVDKLNE